MLHPISRGTVHINPLNPIFSTPIVDYRTLSNPIELDILVEFVKFHRRYYALPSLAPFQPIESNNSINAQTDAEIKEFIKDNLGPSTFHPVGTNPMMPRELGGVVDAELRVYGVGHLRVVDASVIPTIPGAYTQQTTYAIGEKVCGDLVRGWGSEG
jgi:choline dehydrogenase-like flavoprotein